MPVNYLAPLNIDRLKKNALQNKGMARKRVIRRLRILERDHFRCRTCNRSTNLTISHFNHVGYKKRRNLSGWKMDNCRTLCVECHLLVDRQHYLMIEEKNASL